MKKKIFAVIIAIAVFCAGHVNAQYYNPNGGFEEIDFSVSLAGGVSLVNDATSPVASVRLGADIHRFLGELEFSYLSVDAVNRRCEDNFQESSLSTVTFGVNLGVKFLQGHSGYLALMLSGGYSMQEEWRYCDYYCYYGPRHDRYHGKGYFGVGLNGTARLSSHFGLFGEARYQSIPIEGAGRTKWGAVFQGGVRFYF